MKMLELFSLPREPMPSRYISKRKRQRESYSLGYWSRAARASTRCQPYNRSSREDARTIGLPLLLGFGMAARRRDNIS